MFVCSVLYSRMKIVSVFVVILLCAYGSYSLYVCDFHLLHLLRIYIMCDLHLYQNIIVKVVVCESLRLKMKTYKRKTTN